MNVLDLCAGIGGFSLAAHWLGWHTAAFCERDKFCQKVLAKNFPGVPIYDDVFTFPSESFRGRADIITAGFPCQPFSAAGKRKGRDDERHIFPQIVDIVGKVQPAWFVAENVRGLLSIESGRVFSEIISSLEGLGFEVVTHCIPASAVGAPHRRDRLWIVAQNAVSKRAGRQNVSPRNKGWQAREDRPAGIRPRDGAKCSTRAEPTTGDVEGTGCFIAHSDNSGNGTPGRADNANGWFAAPQGDRRLGRLCADIGEDGSDVADSESAECELPRRTRNGRKGLTDNSGNDKNPVSVRRNGRLTESEPGIGRQRELGAGIRERVSQWREPWIEAAARLCSMDDGIPGGLVRPKGWRVGALKAVGNSIVPVIAWEIFRAINEVENG